MRPREDRQSFPMLLLPGMVCGRASMGGLCFFFSQLPGTFPHFRVLLQRRCQCCKAAGFLSSGAAFGFGAMDRYERYFGLFSSCFLLFLLTFNDFFY